MKMLLTHQFKVQYLKLNGAHTIMIPPGHPCSQTRLPTRYARSLSSAPSRPRPPRSPVARGCLHQPMAIALLYTSILLRHRGVVGAEGQARRAETAEGHGPCGGGSRVHVASDGGGHGRRRRGAAKGGGRQRALEYCTWLWDWGARGRGHRREAINVRRRQGQEYSPVKGSALYSRAR